MSNTSQPGQPAQSQPPSFDDIPIAERESPITPPVKSRSTSPRLWFGALFAIALLAAGGWFAYQWWLSRGIASPTPMAASPQPTEVPPKDDRVLNHFTYPEAPQHELEAVSADGGIKMRAPAARAFKDMVAAAGAAGVVLNPLSGFRSIKEQEQVYFEVKAERAQTLEQRALVSAPPGHSEHHTGYAIDIGDGNVPAVNLSPDFDKTAAYKWLSENAMRFNFELSFPKGNKQGVTYEPWHWRFVGDKQSLDTFYRAKEFKQENPSSPNP
ncbi:MAG: D-alanyl-D-alanine carboxypeptidase family protein [Leptolyngbya sp. Prado105]|nr:D-alanyl-D-alanine carboxypeptidase family protein [Leptolyngbya sp. Prado105]